MRPSLRGERSFFLGLLPWPERTAVARALRTETVGGLVLLAAAVVALGWANSPWEASYQAIRDFHFRVPALGLDLSVGTWTASGLLTVFFLVAGIELKRELVVGELRTPATAALPVVAAVCGMAVPAALYVATAAIGGGALQGWAVPMATDIAFALAVLAVLSTHLPSALRAFLLTLAVVDDLGAILVIAVVFKSNINLTALGGAFAGLLVFFLLQRWRVRGWWWYVPLGVAVWALMYNSGIHATVAGVAMGLILRITRDQDTPGRKAEATSPGERTEHLLRPISAGLVAPLFALFAAGVSISLPALAEVFTRPEPLGVVLGLVVGKTVGVFAGTYLAVRFTRARLNPSLAWADVFALAVLAGIGFTVALLIAGLAFPVAADAEHAKAAVLVGSLIAAVLAALLLKRRDRIYRRLWEAENVDEDADGVPDIYQRVQPSVRALKTPAAIYETTRDRYIDIDDLEAMPAYERREFLEAFERSSRDLLQASAPVDANTLPDPDDFFYPKKHVGGLGWEKGQDIVPVSIYIAGSAKDGETLQDAIICACGLYGFELAYESTVELGSWFRRMCLRSRNFLNSSETRQRLKKLESALELEVLGKRRAEVDQTKAEAIGSIIGHIAAQSNAVVRIGSLVIVKMGDNIWAETIDEASARKLEANSTILTCPADAVRFFGLIDSANCHIPDNGEITKDGRPPSGESKCNHKNDTDQLSLKQGPDDAASAIAESG